MKYIVLPLGILIGLSIFGILGVGSTPSLGSLTLDGGFASGCYYDSGGHAKVYFNLTAVDEQGQIIEPKYIQGTSILDIINRIATINDEGYAYWYNSSSSIAHRNVLIDSPIGGDVYENVYLLYIDSEAQTPVVFSQISGTGYKGSFAGMNLNTSLGVLTLVGALIALAAIVGLHVFGSGVSDSSIGVILKGSAYMALWGVFSISGLNLLLQIPIIAAGPVLYTVLTIIYVLGIINSFGNPSSED